MTTTPRHAPSHPVADIQAGASPDDHKADPTGLGLRDPARRRWLQGSLASGFALASGPLVAQAIQTGFEGLIAQEIQLPTGADSIPAYTAHPASSTGPWPVVVVVSEIFGVHEYIADVCRRLAHAGYFAIAPEFFYRIGDPGSLATVADIQSQITSQTPDSSVMSDIRHSLAWACANGGNPQRCGITGFCWGGRITWLACAQAMGLQAGVAWYGRLVGERNARFPDHPMDVAGQLSTPVLGLYGGADSGIPLPQVEQMQHALAGASNPVSRKSRIRVFDQAPHAFHADYRATYREGPARDGWSALLAWFKQHGV